MNELYSTYLDLLDVILDVFDGVAVDVIANVNLLASNHLCPDNCKEKKTTHINIECIWMFF